MMKTWTRVVAVIMVKKNMDSRIVESTDSDNKFYLEWNKGERVQDDSPVHYLSLS